MKMLIISFLLFITSFVYSQEWIRQHPFPKFGFVQDIDMNVDGEGWVVGNESLILHTEDFGNSWFSQQAPIDGWTIQTVAIMPGTNSEIVFAGGNSLIMSEDGGENWSQVSGINMNIGSIQYISENEIFVLGISGAAFSADRGDTWEVLSPKPDVMDVAYFFDLENGILAGTTVDSKIYNTTDGAQTWDQVDTITLQFPQKIQFLDDQTGFILGRDYLYKSTDRGESWERIPTELIGSTKDMKIVDEMNIYVVTNNGSLWKTEDGGNNWLEIRPNLTSNRYFGVEANDQGQIWITSQYSSVFYSNDDGQNWSDQVGGKKEILRDAGFKNDQSGLVVGNGGTILRTEDGGAIWEDISIDPSYNFFGMHYSDENNIWLCGSQGKTLKGNQNGDFTEMTTVGSSGNSIFARTTFDIFLTDENGQLYRSMDGGISWLSQYQSSNQMEKVIFHDEQTGWAVGRAGIILCSIDGGISWAEKYNDSATEFIDIYAISDSEVWALAQRQDSIWHSIDQGASWEKKKLPFSTFWTDVEFANSEIGWISTGSSGSGSIYETRDGGDTWTWSHSSQGPFNSMIAPVDGEDLVWAVGHGGNIMKFSQCTLAPQISNLTGEETPCQGDTIQYQIDHSNVSEFIWRVPSDWLIYGNSNTALVEVIVGTASGKVGVYGISECGISDTLNINVNSRPIANVLIEQQGESLVSLTMGETYQWYDDQGAIPGAVSPSFIPSVTGNYYLRISFSNGCQSLASNVISVVISSVLDTESGEFRIYPNPASQQLNVELDTNSNVDLKVSVWSLNGIKLWNENLSFNKSTKVNLPDIVNGIYLFVLETGDKVYSTRITILH